MKIVKFPDPILFNRCDFVNEFNEDLEKTLSEMYKTMEEAGGIGLSANQVGINKRMFVMKSAGLPLFLINPFVIWESLEIANIKEGCLSAPGEFLIIENRPLYITLSYLDIKGKYHTKMFSGLEAVCARHEVDHLLGISFLQSKTLPRNKRKEL